VNQTLLARELGHPVCEPRVRHYVGPVVHEPGGGEALAQRVGFTGPEAVTAMQLGQRDSLRRVVGMQLEGEPVNLGVELDAQLLGRGLAEPAEGSYVVAPDED